MIYVIYLDFLLDPLLSCEAETQILSPEILSLDPDPDPDPVPVPDPAHKHRDMGNNRQ